MIGEKNNEPSDLDQLRSAVRSYIAQGWYVFPVHGMKDGLCTCGEHCPKPGKHPVTVTGFLEAKNDVSILEYWKYEPYNIGIDLGRSGLAVIDVDTSGSKVGLESLAILQKEYCKLDTALVNTGSGGKHYYYKKPKVKIRKNIKKLPHIDFLSDGCYVIVPPSKHASGGFYSWVQKSKVEEFPEPLLEVLKNREYKPKTFSDSIPEGARNEEIFRRAIAMAKVGFGKEPIIAAIQQMDLGDFPLKEIQRTVSSAITTVRRDGDFVPTFEGVYTRLANKISGSARWCDELGHWFYRPPNLPYWREDNRSTWVSPLAQQINASIREEIKEDMDSEMQKTIGFLYTTHSQQKSAEQASLDKAKHLLDIKPDDLDKPWNLLNTPAGMLDLRTGEMAEYPTDEVITKCTRVSFDPEAVSDLYDRTCQMALGDDEEAFFELVGSMLFNYRWDQSYYVMYGDGGTGKSTILGAVQEAMGNYAVDIRIDEDDPNRKGDHNNLVKMRGARMAFLPEWRQNTEIDPSFVKTLTGDSKVITRPIREREITVHTHCSLVLFANHVPIIKNVDTGIERRMKMVFMNKKIPDSERRDDVVEIIKKDDHHLTAALAKAIKGAIRFWKKKADNPRYAPLVPMGMCSNMDDYIENQSPIQSWLYTCVEFTADQDKQITATELRNHYTQWCKSIGANVVSEINFKSWIDKHVNLGSKLPKNIELKVRRPQGFVYLGVQLKESAREYEDRF